MQTSTPLPGLMVRRTLFVMASALASWLVPTVAHAQAPANDDPCGAVTLTPQGSLCTLPTVSTNANATTTVPNGYGNTGNPLDVWFKFTTAAAGPASFGATITVNGNPATFVQLFSAPTCTGPFASIASSASLQANTTAPRLITGVLSPNTTYYVRVSGNPSFNDQPGPFTICVSDGPGTATCQAPQVTSITQTAGGTVTLAFTPGVNSVPPYAYSFSNTTGGASVTGMSTTSPIVVTGLALAAYTVTLTAGCANGGQASTTTFVTVGAVNDDPCGAVALPFSGSTTCTPTSDTFAGARPTAVTLPSSPCTLFNNPNPIDLWYTVTTTASGPGSTSLTLTSTGGVGLLRLYSVGSTCFSFFNERGCSSGSGLPSTPPLTVTGLTPSTTYYVQAAQSSVSVNAFTLCATAPVSCAAPTNFFVGTVTSNTAPLFFSPGVGNTSYTVTYTPLGGTSQTATFAGLPYTLTNLLPGTPYTLSLVGNCSGGQASAATTTTTTTPGLLNNEPCGALVLPMSGTGCTGVAGTLTGATTTPPNGYPAQGCGYVTGADVWYTFTTAATGPASTGATITFPNGLTKQVRVFSAASCNGPFTEVGCTFSPAPTPTGSPNPVPPLGLSGLTPGTTYYVSVSDTNIGGAPNFSLCVSDPPACPSPSALTVTGLAPTGATLTFTPVAGNSGYTVTYQAAGGTAQSVTPVPSTSPVFLSGLTPGTLYTVTVRAVCAAGTGLALTTSFTTPPAGLTNDECATATPIPTIGVGTCGPAVAGNTTGATPSTGVPVPGCSGTAFYDVWYRLTVPANGILQLETSPVTGSALTDTGLALYSGTCGSLVLRGCDDDTGVGNFSLLRVTGLPPGATVYARVWAYINAVNGAFTICAQTDVACPAVTALAATVTGATASVSFTGTASASGGYTLTYTPAGGTATTVTSATSPLALTGLLPFTTYTVSVVSNCGGGLTSMPTTLTFSTSPYCTTLGGDCSSSSITAVAIPTTTLNNAGTACATVGGNAYTLYPATGSTTATLARSGTYQFRVTTAGNADVTAWIDFNQDGVFAAAEGTQVVLNGAAGLPATASFAVPATATLGSTGMRVRSRGAGAGNGPADACTPFASGETEDYFVTIALPAATLASTLAEKVGLAPNPTTGAVTLTLPAALSQGTSTVRLYNSLGQLVREQALAARAGGSETRVDLRDLAAGVYAVRLTTAVGLVVKRLVVE